MMQKYPRKKKFNLRRRIHGGKCIWKKQFRSEEAATDFAKMNDYNQRAYKCPYCPSYHLTSQDKKESVR